MTHVLFRILLWRIVDLLFSKLLIFQIGRVDEALASSQHLLYFWKSRETSLFEEPSAHIARTGTVVFVLKLLLSSLFSNMCNVNASFFTNAKNIGKK